MTAPRVSVVVAAHDPTHLDAALASIASQDAPGVEIVLVDDGSNPPIAPPRLEVPLRLVRHEVAQERAQARNAGVLAARGEWILVLDHDDLLAAGAIRRLVEAATATGAGAVFGRTARVDADAVAPFLAEPRRTGRPRRLPWWEVCRSTDHFGSPLVRREVATAVGFDPALVPADDYRFAIGVAAATGAFRIEATVAGWRQHAGQTTVRDPDEVGAAAGRARADAIASLRPTGIVGRQVRADARLRTDARSAWVAGDVAAFRRSVLAAIVGWPPIMLSRGGAAAVVSAALGRTRDPAGP